MKAHVVYLVMLIALGALTGRLCADVVSTFDNGDDLWQVVQVQSGYVLPVSGGSAPSWSADTGLLGGGISTSDVYAETFFAAPSAFLGSHSTSFGRNLQFDILISYTDNAAYPAVILTGAGKNLYYNIAPTPVGIWTHRTIPLVGEGWRIASWTGPAATDADMLDVLSNLAGLYINAEWRTGPDATSLDNVILAGPSPVCGDLAHPYPAADLTADCRVNLADFALFAEQWAMFDCSPDNNDCSGADFDTRGEVYYQDLLTLATNWLACTDVTCP